MAPRALGVLAAVAVALGSDNCPAVTNPGQEDADGDGTGDACEEAEPDTTGPAVRILRTSATLGRDGRVAIGLACPDDETSCRGTVTLETVAKGAGRHPSGRHATTLVLGKVRFRLDGGESGQVRVRLTKRGRDLVHDAGRLRPPRAVVDARDAAGNSGTATRLVTIRPARG